MFFILGSDGKEYGPVSVARIQEWIAAGRANLQTKARPSNEPEWRTLGDFPDFSPILAPAAAAFPASPAASWSPAEPAAPAPVFVPQLALAGLGRRFAAASIDGFLLFLCKLPLLLAFVQVFKFALQNPQTPPDPEKLTAMIIPAYGQTVPLLGLLAVVQITLLCMRSQSLGKLLLRLRIVGFQDERPGGPVRAFLLRGFLPTIIEFIPLLGLLFWVVDCCFIFREDRRCIHDLMAGTKVVKF